MADVDVPASPTFEAATARRGLRRGLWSVAVFLAALCLAAFGVSQTEVGGQAIAQLWRQARPELLIPALVCMTLAFLFMGLRWRALMPPGTEATPGGLMAIVCAGLLLNYALPGPMGELGAAWLASRRYRLPLSNALASGVAARLVGLATAAVTAATVWAVADLPVPPEYRPMVGGAVIVIGCGGAVLAALTARPEPWKRLAHTLLRPIARGNGRWARRARDIMAAFDRTADNLSEVVRSRPTAWLSAIGWSAASHGSVVTGVALAALAFGARPDPAGLLFTYATTTAGAVVLFLLPGSQLGWDAMFLGLLVNSAGIPATEATAIALLVRVHHLLVMLLGAISLTWLLRGHQTAPPKEPGKP